MTDELAQIKASLAAERERADYLFDFAESLIAENRRLLDQRAEYAGLIARQRQTINGLQKLVGITPLSQLHLHDDPLARGERA